MRRPLTFLFAGLFTFALLAAAVITTSPAAAATIAATTTCNNGLGNGGAVCEVTVVNTITPSGGSSVVTVRECTGSAGVPDTTCTNTTSPLPEPVTAVTQCDGSINGGGGQLRCSVVVTNNFVGITPSPTTTAVTVNQCVGSADMGSAMVCDPFPATTSGATITQCNGSSNGGGASLTCTATGTQSSGLAVTIDQCNGSSNGGGTLTVCSASITNNILAATPAPTATPPVTGPSASASPGLPNASTEDPLAAQRNATAPLVLGGLLLVALSLVAAFRRRGDQTENH
jgi:hypothetical protein